MALQLLLVTTAFAFGAAAHTDLQAKYQFSAVLLNDGGQYYGLHWNFNSSTESIYFAVNVSTTGWVGFGLSPNGQMPGSDVVIGWVATNGETYFHDRYATGRFLPQIDSKSQDWFLTNSEEESGFTLLEFSRNFTTCDPQDLDISTATARVVWSFSTSDPSSSSGSDARQHDYQGSRSVNLIGGTVSANRDTANENFLDFTVVNVTIPPVETTYWCETFRAPQQFRDTQHYINRIGPVISPHVRAYVHHILVYQCPIPLADDQIGLSMPCNLYRAAESCRRGTAIGVWAVGGEDYIYPDGLAYPIEGSTVAMIEMHYDNPDMTEGVIDSSGMRFYYTTEVPERITGKLNVGHLVFPNMYIPPATRNYTVTGICTADCTKFLPPEGIRVFSNFFHTHLAGRGLTLQHFRYNPDCGVLEELEPIDQNLRYDFNYQQTVILPKEYVVLPGDILVLRCFYETTGRDAMTVGGEGTRDEMCLSFLEYYPRIPGNGILEFCANTYNDTTSFNDFKSYLRSTDSDAAEGFNNLIERMDVLNGLNWASDPLLATTLEESVHNNPGIGICYRSNGVEFDFNVAKPIEPGCSYQAPSKCGGPSPLSCCERVTAGGATVYTSMIITCWMLLLAAFAVN